VLRSRRARPWLVAIAAVALTGALAGCSTFSENANAAQAGGYKLSVDDFESILGDYARLQATDQASGSTSSIADEIGGDEARSLLSRWVKSHLLLGALAARGTPVGDDAIAAAAASMQSQAGTQWPTFDAATQAFLSESQAVDDAVVGDAELQSAYEAGITQSNLLCLRLISFTDIDSANDVYSQLQGGADFATLADQTNGAAGGGQGGIYTDANSGSECLSASGVTDTVLQVLSTTPIGQPTPPQTLSANDGSSQTYIFLQRPWSEVSGSAGPMLRDALIPGAEATLLSGGKVVVDSRYGMWDPSSQTVVATR
jgi:hypothetical protein